MTVGEGPGSSLTCTEGEGGSSMSEATTRFFAGLESDDRRSLIANMNGTLRIELTNGGTTERWLVAAQKGDLHVSHGNAKADCTLRAPEDVFEKLVRGEDNPMAAFLRGAVTVEGDSELVVLFQRLLPGPRK
jgi:putative sterol carrier protein